MELSERTDGNSGHFLPLYLLLLEEGNQYQVYLDDIRSIPLHKLVICCLSVDAVNFCQNNSLEYIVPDDCYTSSEGELSWEMSQSKVADLVTRLNEYYHGIFPSVNGFRFDMGNYHLFMLYHFFGALHFRSFFLSKMIEKHGPDKVLVFKSDAVDNSERPFPVSVYPNCYFELLLNSIYKEKIIPIIIGSIGIGKKIPYKMRVRNLAGRMLRKNSIIKKYLDHARVNLRLNLLELFFKQKKKDILLIGTAGPWKYVFSDSRLSGRIDAVFELDEIDYSSLDVKNWFYQWFGWEDIFCGFDVMALAHHEMTRVKVLSERIVKLHSQTASYISQFKAAIFSVSPYAFQQYMLSVAKHIEIPRICFQHGEMGLYPDGLWDFGSELMYLSHYFSYGDEVSDFKAKRAVSDDFKEAVSIGSPSLDKLRSRQKSEKYILYASSKYIDYGSYVPRYNDLAVKENQDLLVDYFEKYLSKDQSNRVVWKKNQELLTTQPVKKVSNIEVIFDSKSFVDLLPDAKLIVLDRPSTTSLEACMTEKPLFVLLANKNWRLLPEALLKKRAVVAYTPSELKDAIQDYLENGSYAADVNNRDFVRAYGCYQDDGLAAKRAVDKLLDIMGS